MHADCQRKWLIFRSESCPRKGLIIWLPTSVAYNAAYEYCPRKGLIICILLTEEAYILFYAFHSNTNADVWASHRASSRCFGNALADELGHLPIGGLTSVSLHSQIYYKNDLHSLSTVDDGARQALSIGGILNDARKKTNTSMCNSERTMNAKHSHAPSRPHAIKFD